MSIIVQSKEEKAYLEEITELFHKEICPHLRQADVIASEHGKLDSSELEKRAVLRDLIENELENAVVEDISIGLIIQTVADYFELTEEDIKGVSRKKETTYARKIAIYLARELTYRTTEEIGAFFNNRDITTIEHAWAVTSSGRKRSGQLNLDICKITVQIYVEKGKANADRNLSQQNDDPVP